MLDSYIEGSIDRISPEAPVPVVKVTQRENRLGGAANVALNVRFLGAKPLLCSVIGDDENGKQFIDRLVARQISDEGLVISESRQTTVKHRVMSGHHHVIRVDEEDDHSLDESESLGLIRRIDEWMPECDVVILQDYNKGVLTPDIIRAVIQSANKYHKPVAVDPKKSNFFSYEGVTLFKPNFKELQEGLNIQISREDHDAVKSAIIKLKEKIKCTTLMTTLSDQGVMITEGENVIHLPAHYRDVTDVSGAGDTVISVASLCLAAGVTEAELAEWANLAGGLVCEQHGVVPIERDKLKAEAQRD